MIEYGISPSVRGFEVHPELFNEEIVLGVEFCEDLAAECCSLYVPAVVFEEFGFYEDELEERLLESTFHGVC
jgi:hypothetical protein